MCQIIEVFLRGLGGNSASLGELQGDAIRNITGTMGGSASDKVGLWDYGTGVFYQFNLGRSSVEYSGRYYNYVSQGMGFDASRVVPVANEIDLLINQFAISLKPNDFFRK